MLTDKQYKEYFEKLYSLLSDAFLTFYVWKGLQGKEYEDIYKENTNFWSATLISLQNSWLISLAKIYS